MSKSGNLSPPRNKDGHYESNRASSYENREKQLQVILLALTILSSNNQSNHLFLRNTIVFLRRCFPRPRSLATIDHFFSSRWYEYTSKLFPRETSPSRLEKEPPLRKRPRLSSPTPNESEGQPPTVLEATPTQSENQRKYHIITTSIYVLILVLFFR